MMKKLFYFVLASVLFTIGCNEDYDDSALTDRIDNLEDRVYKLETLCSQMNTNILSLQSLVNALNQNDYITNVAPISRNGEDIGYTITFKSGKTITLYHGEDGEDGMTPIIGVKKDSNNIYYWTLNGEWLLDNEGGKMKAVGSDGNDGEDGITPQLKIKEGYWYISYDNGISWKQLEKSTGEDGDAFFTSVSSDDDKVTIVLNDGTVIEIPKHIALELDLIFESTNNIFCEPGTETVVRFNIMGGSIAQIYTIGENGWMGKAEVNNDSKTGKIIVEAPNSSVSGKILVFATDSFGHVIMKALTFTDKLLEIPTLSFNVPKSGGSIEVEVSTNLNYEINISSNASSWISHTSTRAVRNEKLYFQVSENTNTLGRTAEIEIISEDASIEKSIIIYQDGDRYYSTGTGTESDPYVIETIGQWVNFGHMVTNGNSFQNTYFKLGANLDFNNTPISPIGTENAPFSGIIDANNFTISNARITGTEHVGLFGYIKNASLLNFKVESLTISGTKYIGILSGYSDNSKLQDIFVSGVIKSGNYLGGITGYAYNTTLDQCENDANIGNTNSQYIGGIAGYSTYSHISNCINSGSLIGYDCMGGIIGYLDSESSVKNCYNNSQYIQGYLYGMIGGIVGYHCGTLCACAMNNSINGIVQIGWTPVGGITGYDHDGSISKYCYYLKHNIINKNFSHTGDLSWGYWYNYGSYDAYGNTSSGYPVTTKLNEWVIENSTTLRPYKKWSGTIPRFAD